MPPRAAQLETELRSMRQRLAASARNTLIRAENMALNKYERALVDPHIEALREAYSHLTKPVPKPPAKFP